MKLTALLRIKNEMPVIIECLARLSELVDEIVILDNGSTDGTLETYILFPKIKSVLTTTGYHEGRDKCLLLAKAKEGNPDWLIWIDGDEIFEKTLTRADMENYMRSRYDRIRFRMCNFWLSKKYFRIDGKFLLYTLDPQRSMWRNTPETYFSEKKMHNGDIRGVRGRTAASIFRIKHYGYITLEKIARKYKAYESEDKESIRTYEHNRPNAPVRLMAFREYGNPIVHRMYLFAYKYAADALLFFLRGRNKAQRLIYGHL